MIDKEMADKDSQRSPRDDSPLDQATRLIESERSQIGHEIHDALLPLIFAASAGLARVQRDVQDLPPETRGRLEQVADWIDQAMRTGRRLLTQVYPPELIGTLWPRAAIDALERLFPKSEVDVEFQWQVDPSASEPSLPVALTLYRIVIEAARNAITHGKASRITVQGQAVDDQLRVRIVDNGCGFDPGSIPQGHFGVRSMIQRGELVGGRVAVDSTIGGPTTVTFTLKRT